MATNSVCNKNCRSDHQIVTKSKQNVFNAAVPTWSRPATNGSTDVTNNVGNACWRRARPLKIWRKQLMPNHNSGCSRNGVGMPMDKPGGSTNLGKTPNNTNPHPLNTGIVKQHVLKYPDGQSVPSNTNCHRNANNKLVGCNAKDRVIKSASTNLSKKYYSNSSAYLHARCKTYEQNLNGKTYKNQSQLPGPANMYHSLTCPNGSCGNSSADIGKAVPHVYKPNNQPFQVQGAVSSSDRIIRLKLNTIQKNMASFSMWGVSGTGDNCCGTTNYNINESGPYFLKSKWQSPVPKCKRTSENKTRCS